MDSLEKKLCHSFRDRALLVTALTHSSYANENRSRGGESNERLEFLGDSVLGMVVADALYRRFPELPEGYAWANQDCMTLDGLPYVGLFSPHTPDLYVATGFGAWGMTNSMAAATLLADLVQGKKSPYASVYTPSRSMLRPQLLSNLGHTVSNFLRLTPKRCSHMGCALKWNPAEHSWDCPCHGSRFTADGSVLDGPAQSRVDLS